MKSTSSWKNSTLQSLKNANTKIYFVKYWRSKLLSRSYVEKLRMQERVPREECVMFNLCVLSKDIVI